MAITSVKVHPAIGVARLGNSPSDFFIGPEQPWSAPDPPDGFKDAQCRVKRQAARFRVFAYHDDGSVSELTAAEATIEWTVELANKKVAARFPGQGSAAELTIAPGPRTLNGPDQHAAFDTGAIKLPGAAAVGVPLGEVRTDTEGRLLVLGGFGTSASPAGVQITDWLANEGWYDDISDGSVAAHVKLNVSGDQYDALGAWVLVTPPKFAPELEMPTTLYDRLFDLAAAQGWVSAPATPSYTNDIYPILQRARNIGAVAQAGLNHAWPDPIYDQMFDASTTLREHIFDKLTNPANPASPDMPALSEGGGEAWSHLTPTQYKVMERWKENNFARDWAGLPTPAPITAGGLDEAALRACVGAAFYPGIEAGGDPTRPIIDPSLYLGASDPLRLDPTKVSPGDISRWMALPWQTDFNACGATWWPVPRPDWVTPQGTSTQVAWDRNIGSPQAMIQHWSTLGFVLDQGGSFVEVESCPVGSILLTTPHLDFQNIPQGAMGAAHKTALAIVFEVLTPGASVTLEVPPGAGPSNPRLTLAAPAVTVGPTAGSAIATARLWLIYQTGAVGEHISDQLTVTNPASGETWAVTVSAGTVARKVAAAALVLDRSGSMAEDAGDGQSKHDSLVQAASIFVDVMLEGDGIGLIAFNEAAATLQGITALGDPADPFDPQRTNTKNAIAGSGLTPGGGTSIGAGIEMGAGILGSAGANFDTTSLVVLTDGMENAPPSIAEAANDINGQTYAVGLGTPQNISTTALQTISGNNGGYLLITGAISGDNRFLLQKYFLQILAGVSNAEIVLDPDGILVAGAEQQIPFQLTEADTGVDVILLTPAPELVELQLQGPSGNIITPAVAGSDPSVAHVESAGVKYYRISLPVEFSPTRFDQAGTWRALLRYARRVEATAEQGAVRGLPYSVVVHAYSDLSLRARLEQWQFDPGSTVGLHATLSESDIPLAHGAHVRAEILRPDGTAATVALAEDEPGHFAGSFTTTLPGVYRFRVRASGRSSAGYHFQREQTLTAGVWYRSEPPERGGQQDGGNGQSHGTGSELEPLCRLLRCLLAEDHILSAETERRLGEEGINLAALRRCIAEYCEPRTKQYRAPRRAPR